ncbi:TetR/AcrR family transcriptional regulator [Dictyobacter kobayashii]|uniref:HTH tetR-type domain-containing protein n=1 Tax=Dictyobacter kobayashii TaxID=2014872 RepID=A0A402AYT7_9CHLR|nr:TetR/AcrR family transcriptional regulator [Dictyobacter kobayashii]GCE24233.1 hypothetical protein KDK_80330 [Dictyobacter kobayashii]
MATERGTRAMQNDERRRSLVLAAYHLIAEKGLEQLRTRDVAAQAGVNIATLHYHFSGKEDLIQAVVEYVMHIFSTPLPVTPEIVKPTTAWDQLKLMFYGIQYRQQATPELFVVLSELVLRAQRSPAMQPLLKQLDAGWHGYLKQVIGEGVQRQQFRSDLDPETTATEFIVLLKGQFFTVSAAVIRLILSVSCKMWPIGLFIERPDSIPLRTCADAPELFYVVI